MEATKPRKVIRISRTKLIIGIIAIVTIVILIIVGMNRSRRMYGGMLDSASVPSMGIMATGGSVNLTEIPMMEFGGGNYPNSYPYQNGTPDITDTREFLKTSYSAQIQTKDVADKVRDVKNAVRDVDGRIDNFSSSEKYGYVSFVVPKDKFDDFKDEVELLVHKKLYTENVSSQNLLGQKQGIEEQKSSLETRLAQLEKQKKDLDAQYAATLTHYAVSEQDVEVRNNLIKEETRLYTEKSGILQGQINQTRRMLEGNAKQDTQFTNNIETVNGVVNVNWVSNWEMVKIFSPIHPTIIIIVLVITLIWFLNRKAYLPKIEIV